jgi:hypothetical protein
MLNISIAEGGRMHLPIYYVNYKHVVIYCNFKTSFGTCIGVLICIWNNTATVNIKIHTMKQSSVWMTKHMLSYASLIRDTSIAIRILVLPIGYMLLGSKKVQLGQMYRTVYCRIALSRRIWYRYGCLPGVSVIHRCLEQMILLIITYVHVDRGT